MMDGVRQTGNINFFDDKKKAPNNEMGKDAFLKLLMAQMKNQDPTNPMKDTEYVAQLATFNALEQQVNTNKNLEKLIQLNSASAVGFVGRLVGYTGENGEPVAEKVQFVDFIDGKIRLNFESGKSIYIDQVQQVG